MKKQLTKCIAWTALLSLILTGAVQAQTVDDYPDCVVYDYSTGSESILSAESFMLSEEVALLGQEEKISLPYDPPAQTKGIVAPSDNRQKVDATVSPYCKILCLWLGRDTNGDGTIDNWAGGTGALVYDDIMLTAGHCMYNETYGYVDEMRIYVKQNSATFNSTFYYPASWSISQAYINDTSNNDYDWCVVKLQNSLGLQVGWFGYGIPSSTKTVIVSGYPDNTEKHHFQYSCSGTMRVESDYRVSHSADTEGGQSGAPIFTASDQIIWGIHTSTSNYVITDWNYGCKITSYLYNLIESKK